MHFPEGLFHTGKEVEETTVTGISLIDSHMEEENKS